MLIQYLLILDSVLILTVCFAAVGSGLGATSQNIHVSGSKPPIPSLFYVAVMEEMYAPAGTLVLDGSRYTQQIRQVHALSY